MARFSGVSKGWRITAVVLFILFAVVTTICIVAGVKAGTENIGFFDALGQIFGATGEAAGEVVEDVVDNAGEVVDGAETLARMI